MKGEHKHDAAVDTPRSELLKLTHKLSTRAEITSILEVRFLIQWVSAGPIALPDRKHSRFLNV